MPVKLPLGLDQDGEPAPAPLCPESLFLVVVTRDPSPSHGIDGSVSVAFLVADDYRAAMEEARDRWPGSDGIEVVGQGELATVARIPARP